VSLVAEYFPKLGPNEAVLVLTALLEYEMGIKALKIYQSLVLTPINLL